MEKFVKPLIEVIKLTDDVITTSETSGSGHMGDEDGGDDIVID